MGDKLFRSDLYYKQSGGNGCAVPRGEGDVSYEYSGGDLALNAPQSGAKTCVGSAGASSTLSADREDEGRVRT
jgi:hypothetical protein